MKIKAIRVLPTLIFLVRKLLVLSNQCTENTKPLEKEINSSNKKEILVLNAASIDTSGNMSSIQQLRIENTLEIPIAHIKINSIRNKFESLIDIVSSNLLIFEAKIEGLLRRAVFYRLQRTNNGGCIPYAKGKIYHFSTSRGFL